MIGMVDKLFNVTEVQTYQGISLIPITDEPSVGNTNLLSERLTQFSGVGQYIDDNVYLLSLIAVLLTIIIISAPRIYTYYKQRPTHKEGGIT